ncbi:MAG: GumC family protein, partial [Candidatus Korobacteraceae bacterium]
DSYIEHNIRSHFETTTQTSEWLQRQLTDLQLKVETTQQKLLDYQREEQLIGVDDKQNIISSKLDQLNRELTAAEHQRIEKEANYKLALTGDAELISSTVHPSLLATLTHLQEQENALNIQAAQLAVQFGPSHPKLVEINTQRVEIRKAIAAEVQKGTERLRTEYQVALQREQLLRKEMEGHKTEAGRLAESSIGYSLLRRDADTSRQLYEGLLQKLKEAQVSAGLNSSNIQVVDMARVPGGPSRPNKRMNITLGVLMGLGCGIGLAFLLEALDTTIRSPEAASAISGLPSLGVIPLTAEEINARPKLLPVGSGPRRPTEELVSQVRPRSQAAEAFRALRTSLLLAGSGAPPKVIAFTSALPRDGKTTSSVNCATVLAQMGARVLVVDADLRKPAVHKAFGVPNRSGLSKVLASGQGLETVAIPCTQVPGLDVITAGATPPHPAELLGSSYFLECLAYWRKNYDHIVIDTPPVLSVTDAVVLSVHADAVVLVSRAGQTTKHALRHARALLGQVKARVIGVLLNGVDLASPDYYYYSSYYSYSKEDSYYDTANTTVGASPSSSSS